MSLLVATDRMKLHIAERAGVAEIRELSYGEGMRTTAQDGVARLLPERLTFSSCAGWLRCRVSAFLLTESTCCSTAFISILKGEIYFQV